MARYLYSSYIVSCRNQLSVLSIPCKITKFDLNAFVTQLNLYVTSTTWSTTYFIKLGYSFIGVV